MREPKPYNLAPEVFFFQFIQIIIYVRPDVFPGLAHAFEGFEAVAEVYRGSKV